MASFWLVCPGASLATLVTITKNSTTSRKDKKMFLDALVLTMYVTTRVYLVKEDILQNLNTAVSRHNRLRLWTLIEREHSTVVATSGI